MRNLRYGPRQGLMVREHLNAGWGDIPQTSITQSNGEVGRPPNVAGSECVIFPNKKKGTCLKNGMRNQYKREELTGSTRNTRRGGSLSDKGSLVRAGRDGTRSEAAARGRRERRRVGGSREKASCRRDTQIIMKAISGIRKSFLVRRV